MDHEGYVYVSTFAFAGRVYRFNPDFGGSPLVFAKYLNGPANLHYNRQDSILAIPSTFNDIITYHPDIYKIDSDEDGSVDAYDNCPYNANPGQEDLDLDSTGNVCDNCPDAFNPAQEDINGNGIGDVCEIPEMWYVRPDGMGDVVAIQTAIDSSTHGDTIIVADGLYEGEDNRALDFGGRQGIVLSSENGPELTII
ncbi:MAG: hypothetical protein GY869_06400, partial [Planctomycetes bacterium]|nr:hypothetical protein [Planctomycetota bacterium]